MENGSAPATKQDVVDATATLRHELGEIIRDNQNELLKALYGFAESNRQRVTQLEANQAAIIARMGVLENRILDLERKLYFPRQPVQ